MSHYQKGATFARNYPCMFYSNPATHSDKEGSLNSAMARNWHIDHSRLIQFAVLLRDTDTTSTRMQVIAGTQKYHSVAKAHYSDKYISEFIESKNYEVIDCVGPAGTVYIFDSTVLHRVVQVPDRPRLLLKFEFTSGSNVLLDCNLINDCLF